MYGGLDDSGKKEGRERNM